MLTGSIGWIEQLGRLPEARAVPHVHRELSRVRALERRRDAVRQYMDARKERLARTDDMAAAQAVLGYGLDPLRGVRSMRQSSFRYLRPRPAAPSNSNSPTAPPSP